MCEIVFLNSWNGRKPIGVRLSWLVQTQYVDMSREHHLSHFPSFGVRSALPWGYSGKTLGLLNTDTAKFTAFQKRKRHNPQASLLYPLFRCLCFPETTTLPRNSIKRKWEHYASGLGPRVWEVPPSARALPSHAIAGAAQTLCSLMETMMLHLAVFTQ